ncbi:hypothetical protein ACIRPR_32585 [Streptomyces griseoflavus]|uniref:hypothetical protein n=1 Tax=Streptomyces griseoflavus TaxID=35619 RepID=UPI0038017762
MNGDEQLLNGRVYGAEHDDPNPGPLPHRTYAELVGGPLDGLLLDIHGWRTEEVDDGVALSTELSRWPGGRALYDPRPGRTPHARPGCELPLLLLRRHTLTTGPTMDPTTAPAAPTTEPTTADQESVTWSNPFSIGVSS